MSALVGRWETIRAEQGGEHSPDLGALGMELEFTVDRYTVRLAGRVTDAGSYVRDATTLVLTGTAGPNANRTLPCLYQLTGDRLRVSYGLDGTTPAGFTTAAGEPHYVAFYRRKPIGPPGHSG